MENKSDHPTAEICINCGCTKLAGGYSHCTSTAGHFFQFRPDHPTAPPAAEVCVCGHGDKSHIKGKCGWWFDNHDACPCLGIAPPLTLHLSETQKKLDSARAALEHYANEDHWRWDRDEDLNAYMATDHGPLIARKWLDAELGEGE